MQVLCIETNWIISSGHLKLELHSLLENRIIESQNYKMVWVARDFQRSTVPKALQWAGILFTRWGCSKLPSNLILNISRDGTWTPSLGNLFQCFIALIMKNVFLMSSLNVPSFNIKPLPLVLSAFLHRRIDYIH